MGNPIILQNTIPTAVSLLSYAPIYSIDVNTEHSDISLNEDTFTIMFDLSMRTGALEDESFYTTLTDFTIDTFDIYEINDIGDRGTILVKGNQTTKDFFPIFTTNKTLLFNGLIDNIDYFYNAHCCYIYQKKLHLLINDLSDIPLMHLKINLETKDNQSYNDYKNITVLLTCNKNIFSAEVVAKKEGPSVENENMMIDFKSIEANDIDIDLFNVGNLTLGYAERLPISIINIPENNSYHYKNSLNGFLNKFKIFKGIIKSYKKLTSYSSNSYYINTPGIGDYVRYNLYYEYVGDNLGDLSIATSRTYYLDTLDTFDNYSKNSKYVIGDKVYNNIGNNICKVNLLFDKNKESSYQIYSIESIVPRLNLQFIKGYDPHLHQSNMPDSYISSAIVLESFTGADSITLDSHKDKIPLIKFELERDHDSTSIDFLEEEFYYRCIYNTIEVLTNDLVSSPSTKYIMSYYDIFNIPIVKDYLITAINEKIKHYKNLNINVTNLKIYIKNDQLRTCIIKYVFNHNIENSSYNNYNINISKTSTIKNIYAQNANELYSLPLSVYFVKTSVTGGIFYNFKNISTVYPNGIITTKSSDDVTFITNNNKAKFSNNYNLNNITFDTLFNKTNIDGKIQFSSPTLYPYNYSQYNKFLDSEMQKFYSTTTDTFYNIYGPSLYGKIPLNTAVQNFIDAQSSIRSMHNGYSISVENTDGVEICKILKNELSYKNMYEQIIPYKNIYKELINVVSYKDILTNIYKIVAQFENGEKYIIDSINPDYYSPMLIYQLILPKSSDSNIHNIENLISDYTIHQSDLLIKFDKSVFNATNNNLLFVNYNSCQDSTIVISNPSIINTLLNDNPILTDTTNFEHYTLNHNIKLIDALSIRENLKYDFIQDAVVGSICNTFKYSMVETSEYLKLITYINSTPNLNYSYFTYLTQHDTIINSETDSWYIK